MKEQALQNAEIRTQQKAIQMQYIIISVILFLVVMLIAWLYFLQKAHRKQKQLHQVLEGQNRKILTYTLQLEEKNIELEESKEEIQLLNESLEEKVKERTRTLEIANEKLRNYSFLNSHAVRRPLANILGLVNIFDHVNPESEENKTYLTMLTQSANELDEVIHNINQQLSDSEKTL